MDQHHVWAFCGAVDCTYVDVKGRERNAVVSSFNRNVADRDGNPETCSIVTSPKMVTAFA
jgi:aconitate hydratase